MGRKEELNILIAKNLQPSADALRRANCVFVKQDFFTLKSGLKSHTYVDARQLKGFPEERRIVRDSILDVITNPSGKIAQAGLHFLSDTPTGTTYFTGILTDHLDWPMVSPKVVEKSHGRSVKVEGKSSKTAGVPGGIFEDLGTTGGSLIEATKALREDGLEITDALFLVDRMEGAEENVTANNLRFHTLFRLPHMLRYYYLTGQLSQEEYQLAIPEWETIKQINGWD